MARKAAQPGAPASKAVNRFQPRGPEPEPEAPEGFQRYPAVKYKRAPVGPKAPNGYLVKKVYDEQEEAALDTSWKDSPEDL